MMEKDWTRKLFKEKKTLRLLACRKQNIFFHAVNRVVSQSREPLFTLMAHKPNPQNRAFIIFSWLIS